MDKIRVEVVHQDLLGDPCDAVIVGYKSDSPGHQSEEDRAVREFGGAQIRTQLYQICKRSSIHWDGVAVIEMEKPCDRDCKFKRVVYVQSDQPRDVMIYQALRAASAAGSGTVTIALFMSVGKDNDDNTKIKELATRAGAQIMTGIGRFLQEDPVQ